MSKKEDLKTLKNFILRPKVEGWISNMYYWTLRKAYPLEFLRLMDRHRNLGKEMNDIALDDKYIREAEEAANCKRRRRPYIGRPHDDVRGKIRRIPKSRKDPGKPSEAGRHIFKLEAIPENLVTRRYFRKSRTRIYGLLIHDTDYYYNICGLCDMLDLQSGMKVVSSLKEWVPLKPEEVRDLGLP